MQAAKNINGWLYLVFIIYSLLRVNIIAWLSLCFILERSWVALYSDVCQSVSQSVRHRCHPTKSPLFPIYTGIQALCWPNTIYKGIKALFWVTHSILGLVCSKSYVPYFVGQKSSFSSNTCGKGTLKPVPCFWSIRSIVLSVWIAILHTRPGGQCQLCICEGRIWNNHFHQ